MASTGDGAYLEFANVWIPAGSYTPVLWTDTRADQPVIDVYVGATEVASFDTYSVGTVNRVRLTDSAFSVSTSGYYTVTYKVDGKNGSSSNYNSRGYILIFQKA